MSGSSWGLVIPVLLGGLALGAAWVFWARRSARPAAESKRRDDELLVADLQARQDMLYEQLREAEGAERDELELAAARNLKALEEALGRRPPTPPAAARGDESPTAAAGSPARRPSAVVGFLGGVACAALVAVLVIWAQRDAQPRPDETGAMAPRPGDERHPEGPLELDPREAEALQRIAAAVDSDPTDLMARKQYAVALLSTGQFFAAFEQAQILLASDAADPDGLYVKGMVRMRMGQHGEAQALLERLVADYPDHVSALTALGVLALRGDGLEAADVYWDRAVEASGGENADIEQLRAAARRQLAEAPPADATATPATPAAPVAAPAADPQGYTLRLELAAGVVVPPGGVLFVSLRQGDSGPPAAVKRIAAPRFPMTLVLGSGDSMLGRPLPADGTVTARVDSDGNVATSAAGEPTAEVAMAVGETASLTLR